MRYPDDGIPGPVWESKLQEPQPHGWANLCLNHIGDPEGVTWEAAWVAVATGCPHISICACEHMHACVIMHILM